MKLENLIRDMIIHGLITWPPIHNQLLNNVLVGIDNARGFEKLGGLQFQLHWVLLLLSCEVEWFLVLHNLNNTNH